MTEKVLILWGLTMQSSLVGNEDRKKVCVQILFL